MAGKPAVGLDLDRTSNLEPRTSNLELRTSNFVVGVDLGGTKILTMLADGAGQVLARVKAPTQPWRGLDAVLDTIVDSVEQVASQAGVLLNAVRTVGVGVPGLLDRDRQVVFLAPNLNWRDVPLGALLGDRLALPVRLENDANLAALGEYAYGAGRGESHLVYITVSTGVGCGIVLDGSIYRGAGGGAGEIGHLTVAPGGPLCNCGNNGCLEAVASGTAIARQARALVAEGRGAGILAAAGGAPEQVSARTVAEAAGLGAPEAVAILRDAGRFLGLAVAGLINLLNPSALVLGGGVLQSDRVLWDAMSEEINRRTLSSSLAAVRVVRAELAGDAGVLGAVALALAIT